LDVTCRFGSPPSELQSVWIQNLGEVIYACARGETAEIEYVAPFGGQLCLRSPRTETHAIPVRGGDGLILHGEAYVDGNRWAIVPGHDVVGAVVAYGNSLEEVVERLTEEAEKVEGFQVSYRLDSLAEALDIAKTGRKLGLEF
jgi:hypothetical protein